MKSNAQQILLSLFQAELPVVPQLPLRISRVAVPQLSESGWRSLVYGLKKQGYLDFDSQGLFTKAVLTQPGQQLLKSLFPALFAVVRLEWHCVFCLAAPKQDPGFRFFRSEVLRIGGVPLQRGSYLIPGELPAAFLDSCAALYPESVMIGQVTNWEFGDLRRLLKNHHLLQDTMYVYSGISSEESKLLAKNYAEIELMQSEKQVLSSVFARLATALKQDPGFVTVFMGKAIQPVELLSQWQRLVVDSCFQHLPE